MKTALRTSIVLGKKGGAFIILEKLPKFGLGGKQGSGNQLISWIHEEDFARAIDFVIEKEMISVVNIVSPQPVTNSLFMSKLRRELNSSIRIPTPKILLQIGAKIIGTEPELVLKSRNVIPERLLENGFEFQFRTLDNAFKDLGS